MLCLWLLVLFHLSDSCFSKARMLVLGCQEVSHSHSMSYAATEYTCSCQRRQQLSGHQTLGSMTRKRLLCSSTLATHPLPRAVIPSCNLTFPCQGGCQTSPYLRDTLVCCRIKCIGGIQSARTIGSHCWLEPVC